MTETNYKYANKYGSLTLKKIGDFKKVSEFHSKNFSDNVFFSADTAEKIALITGNLGIQMSIVKRKGEYKGFVIKHKSSSVAVLTKIDSITFDKTINPTKEIEDRQHDFPLIF